MKNFLVVKDGFEKVLPADWMSFNNDTGQTMLFCKKTDHVTAILPKECIIIETTDLTEYQELLQEVIRGLSDIRHHDFERIHPKLMELDEFKKGFQLLWLERFECLYEKTL